jgi:hypothetical protein
VLAISCLIMGFVGGWISAGGFASRSPTVVASQQAPTNLPSTEERRPATATAVKPVVINPGTADGAEASRRRSEMPRRPTLQTHSEPKPNTTAPDIPSPSPRGPDVRLDSRARDYVDLRRYLLER